MFGLTLEYFMSQSYPLLSVLMSVYKEGPLLQQCLSSVINQSFTDFEFIIILDGQDNETDKLIKNYAAADERIKIFKNSENIGLTRSLNKGLDYCRGKYIARIDADDENLQDRFYIQYNFLEKNPDVFLCGCGAHIIDKINNCEYRHAFSLSGYSLKNKLLKSNLIRHSGIMFQNKDHIRYRDKFVYSQDYDLYLRLLSENKKIKMIPEVLIKYYYLPTAITGSKRYHQKLFFEKAKEFYFERKKLGKDSYANFNEKEIINIDPENSTNKILLIQMIKSSLAAYNLPETRKIIFRYFRSHGIINKYLLYYLITFLGKNSIKIIRRFFNI